MNRVLPLVLVLLGFAYFILRERQQPRRAPQTPEDVLVEMVQAMGRGDVSSLLNCLGGDLRRRLQDLAAQRGDQLAALLKERNQAVKGFAILEKEARASGTLLVLTETVYADRNTRQTFLLREEKEGWKIIETDSEMVSDWETDFGKSVREVP